MENEQKIKVALIRADNLNEWEGKLWHGLGPEFVVEAFCSQYNPYPVAGLKYPIHRLWSSTDNFFLKNFHKYFFGQYKVMYGLEEKLAGFDIAHTAEIFNFFTTQAVRAKKSNPKLKVINYFADNTFGRFEYNYWPGFACPPAYWRQQINDLVAENIKGIDMFVTITEYSAELLRDYGIEDSRIKVLTLPIVMEEGEDTFPALATQHHLTDKNFYMFVGRLTKEKGIYELLYAWRMFLKKSPSFQSKKLLLIGNGPERINVLRLINELGLDDSIVYIKELSNQVVRSLYRHAKTLLLPSIPTSTWQEQFGYVLAEAIYNNCPVISTYSGAIPEVIEDAGLLCLPGNPVSLRDALIKLEDQAVYQSLQQNCRRVAGKFSVDHFRKSLAEIYHQVL